MKSTNSASPQLHLPPGFRFHPTDEELVVHYLTKKAESKPFPVPVIAEVDLYKFNPWDLPEKAYFGEREWYFFTPRDRKYPNGARPNRAAASGYWKATGTDKPIFSRGNKKVGVKKALVFYDGKAPKGVKTNWIMHEYRLANPSSSKNKPAKDKSSLRLDDWVLCRIYEKTSSAFKVMVSNFDAEPTKPLKEVEQEAEAEPEPEAEAEAEAEEAESGLDEMLASLPDIEGCRLPFPNLGGAATPNTPHPFEDLLRSADSLSERSGSGVLQAQYPVDYTARTPGFEDSFHENSRLFSDDLDNKLDLNYWSLYPQSSFFGKEVSPLLRKTPNSGNLWPPSTRKRTRISREDEDVQSTCRSPLPCKRPQQSFAIF